ncbi:hypothetical protein MTO96_040237, partial [Rhipicephalus appendiculatus]
MAGWSRPVSTRVMVLEGPRGHSRDSADDAEDRGCQLSDGWIKNAREEQAFPERPRCRARDVKTTGTGWPEATIAVSFRLGRLLFEDVRPCLSGRSSSHVPDERFSTV